MRARAPLARVASEKASGPTPLGLAPERQSGLRALIIARPAGRGEGATKFTLPPTSRRLVSSVSRLRPRHTCGWLARSGADSWGRSGPHSRAAAVIGEGRRSPRTVSVFASLPSSIHASRVRSAAQAHRGLYTRT